MARKRKSRATETPTEPEPVQTIEPEPEQPEPEEAPQNQDTGMAEEEEAVGAAEDDDAIETKEVVEEEEEEVEEVEEEQAGEAEMVDAEHDAAETNEPETEISDKPSEIVPENGGVEEKEDEKEVKEEEEEEELEEEPLEKLLEPFTKDQLTLLVKEAVAKYPDLVENVNKLADLDPAHRKIFVHGLGWDATTETITAVYGKYGEIEDCRVVKDKNTGKSKGYGFILFKHRSGARRALKEPQKLIEGRMTSCQLASAGPAQASPSPNVVAVATPSPPVSEYTLRKIFVSNVSAEIDPTKLVEFFSTFGEIEEGPLGLDKQTGKPKGFCLFVYKSVEGAKKALEEPHKEFEGVVFHCQKAVDGPKHSKGGFFQQTPPQQQQHHHQGKQGYYNHPAKKGRYAGSSGGMGRGRGGHLMAPSAGPGVPPMGFNPAVAPAAIGQAVAALLANPNLIGGIGGGMNPQGVSQMMNNAGYGGQGGAGGYGAQPGLQGGYGGQPQMGQGGVRPHQGGPPYMGHGR